MANVFRLTSLAAGNVNLNLAGDFSWASDQDRPSPGYGILAVGNRHMTWGPVEDPFPRWLALGKDSSLLPAGPSLQEWAGRCGNEEPLCRGKTLSECIGGLAPPQEPGNNLAGLDAAREAAKQALKELGASSLPWLLKWLQSDDFHRQLLARRAFILMRTDALPVMSALGELARTNSLDLRAEAYAVISAISPDWENAWSALLPALHHPSQAIRYQAGRFLCDRYPWNSRDVGLAELVEWEDLQFRAEHILSRK